MGVLNCKEKNEYEEALISKVVACIEKQPGKECLSSIILTGSLGRGEATYIVEPDGSIELKSDVEIALVYTEHKNSVEEIIQNVSAEFEEDMNLFAVSERRVRNGHNFNGTILTPRYKTIFTYDLYNGSKTIWGTDFIAQKKIGLEDCDLYEAKRLVANRIGELVYLKNTVCDEEKEYLRKQWKGKLILSIASAWLICNGTYVSSYRGQYNELKRNKNEVNQVLGKDFFENYQKVFAFLRESVDVYEVPDNVIKEYVKKIDKIFKWKSIDKPRTNCMSRRLKYFAKYIKTDMKFGEFGFENKILQSLIDSYCSCDTEINVSADYWHQVLY